MNGIFTAGVQRGTVGWVEMSERFGNCLVIEEIGSGGMAVVYKAVQQELGRDVAIKVLKPTMAVEAQFSQRFDREAHFMASLNHENILQVYDYVSHGELMYIVMEYVEGVDVFDLLEQAVSLPAEVAAIVALQVARALDHAHFRGVIHRDIKPANIMVGKNGTVKLMDFGIARDNRQSDLTQTGTGVGTPSYMSPEQILGDRMDFRSDIFSLGIVLYQMATGRKPFQEDDAQSVMQKIRLERPLVPRKIVRTIPRHLERIILRCLEKVPANRFPSTQALIDELSEFLAPRVGMNYSARLVMYLRGEGLVSPEDADELLRATFGRSELGQNKDRRLLRHVGLIQGAALMTLIGATMALRGGDKEPLGLLGDYDSKHAIVSENKQAKLRVVATPWADVSVDGVPAFSTPHDEPLLLEAGKHFVKFENPFYASVEREVVLQAETTTTLRVTLQEPKANEKTKEDKQ